MKFVENTGHLPVVQENLVCLFLLSFQLHLGVPVSHRTERIYPYTQQRMWWWRRLWKQKFICTAQKTRLNWWHKTCHIIWSICNIVTKWHACMHSSSKSNITNSPISYNICNFLTVSLLSFSYLILWPSHLWKDTEHYALLYIERQSPILVLLSMH